MDEKKMSEIMSLNHAAVTLLGARPQMGNVSVQMKVDVVLELLLDRLKEALEKEA